MRIDRHTHEYLNYKEHTPGTLLVAPAELLNRRMGDVIPDVAALYLPAAHAAAKTGQMQIVSYGLRGQSRVAHIVVVGQSAIVSIKAVDTPAAIACRG
jgi:hypothetical protein